METFSEYVKRRDQRKDENLAGSIDARAGADPLGNWLAPGQWTNSLANWISPQPPPQKPAGFLKNLLNRKPAAQTA